jgi:uncharacterized surface protein with fasciclin (FAS1) repeats
MKRNFITTKGVFIMAAIMLVIYSCKKEIFKLSTTSDVNITGYLEENPEYSMLLEIMAKSKTQGYLGAYGTYTLFAPTNTAIQAWLTENGKTSVNDFSDEELLKFIKYHVIKDTVSTVRFTDGKIKTPTLFGEYLYTDVVNGTYRINKQALISKSNILCGNGVIQAIDKVLVPPAKNLAELVESNPNYSIFTEALKRTGFYDTLSYQRGQDIATEKRFQTVIVQSDSLYHTMGINNYDDLAAKYSTKNDPQNHADSLWLYMAYHITNDGKFLQDIASSPSLYTLAPKEIISTKLDTTKVLLNEAVFNGILEPGAEIIRSKSDNLASNGVMHEAKDNFYIKVRKQVPVYFDLADSPELIAGLGAAYHNSNKELMVDGASIASSVIFEDPTKSQGSKYDYWNGFDAKRPRANGDYLNLSMCNANSARQKYIEFKTPYLVKGRYKVWICYVQFNYGAHLQTSYDPGTPQEQILPNIAYTNLDLGASGVNKNDMAQPNADNLMLAQGYKRYMATTAEYSANGVRGLKPLSGNDAVPNVGRLAGIINVETTDRHIIRLTAIGEGRCATNNTWVDMIQFIPADDTEQNYPRFHVTPGELFYRP